MTKSNNTNGTPRIYVASLADYTSGTLHGKWIDATQSADDIRREITEMLRASKEPFAEEWAIHDYENFDGLTLGEYESIDAVAEAVAGMKEHGPMFGALLNSLGGLSELENAKRYIEEQYRGSFESLSDYAYELVDECYADVMKALPEFVRCHIDYEAIAHDLEISGDIFVVQHGGELHVFWGES